MIEILIDMLVKRVRDVAEGIREFELVDPQGSALPAFTPGAHINVRTPEGHARKYSLCNPPSDGSHYLIAVKRDEQGGGGSRSMHLDVTVGTLLKVSAPENAFPLAENGSGYIFIAGGIGITPILSMVRYLQIQRPASSWRLIYLTRDAASTPYSDELQTDPRVCIHYSGETKTERLDLWPLLEQSRGEHLYCCGPNPLMNDVRDMTGHWPSGSVHFESFKEGGETSPSDTPFNVRLARSGRNFVVPVGRSILDMMRANGMDHVSSCESGTCGTCKTALLSGEADHRDMVLMPEERAGSIMICVSRAKSGDLVLDL